MAIRRRYLRPEDPFTLNDNTFKRIFRVPKELAREVINILADFLEAPSRRSALHKDTKVLVALHFFATGSYQLDIGYNTFSGISQASVSRCINEVTEVLNRPEIFNQWIRFPNTIEELRANRRNFFEKFHFPGVVGVIDGTHVAIVPPNQHDAQYPEHIYVNRKGYHSINTQLVCDANMKILNVNARFPGSVNDMYIWNHSILKDTMTGIGRQHPNEFYLLGDSGYALRPWLQIPLANPEPGPQEQYNQALIRTRCVIERCIGLLKMRFRCLLKHRVLHYKPTTASKIINACAVLHNICVTNNIVAIHEDDHYPEIEIEIFNQIDEGGRERVNRELLAGRQLQQRIIHHYFED
ncbi:hypothetical protein NQ315_006577 [Exocentrus adspersus]|uniref:Putative nuclease HARBI1 n=1 Tax=Exocentrus adspersus TaxID=1586481 RepID=A0AAV8VGT2_9CUCU|nr:hypothetical protein NQ315_006577 [Exocentrus adspersus]